MAKGSSLGTSSGVNVSQARSTVKGIYASNTNAAARYLQILDQVSGPNAGDVPSMSFLIPPNGGTAELGTEFFGTRGVSCKNGISICVSTAAATYQPATPGDHLINWITG